MNLFASGDAVVTISGGTFGHALQLIHSATATIIGTAFNYAYGVYGYEVVGGLGGNKLEGTLADGTDFNNLILIGSYNTVVLAAPAAIPEPSSIAMFGIGALGLFGYSRRRRQTSAAA